MLGSAAGKVTGLVALGVLAVAGVTAVNLVPGEDSEVASSPTTNLAVPAPDPVSEPSVAATEPVVAAELPSVPANAESEAVAEATPPAVEPAPGVAPTSEAAADEDDQRLREEIALLDAARSALERGDREAARSSLRTYRERFPSGVLAREANVLRRRAEPARAKR